MNVHIRRGRPLRLHTISLNACQPNKLQGINRYHAFILKLLLFIITTVFAFPKAFSQTIVEDKKSAETFVLTTISKPGYIYVDPNDFAVTATAVSLLQQDIERVTGAKPPIVHSLSGLHTNVLIVGTMGSSTLLKQLISEKKIDTIGTQNKWEAFTIQSLTNPFAGIPHALVIAGSDRRGTAYGVFELSKEIGVSPWYWWADVPVKHRDAIFIKAKAKLTDAPKVKYRGIFINDEAPALSGWTSEKFGGFNHHFYAKVFELILRLKGNYLWPAMWGNAFYDDDSLNMKTADDYAVVIGTSHHEPLMRAHDEWRRYGKGAWDYDSNEVRLKEFWRTGMDRATNEKIVSIGMRGDGDKPMSRETATSLLERIVHDQRQIIEQVTGKPASETPQLWALYKEVQDYYDKGMRVPDDVTLLLCDDNWGNLRKLPKQTDAARKGGYGIYYHFDYVGDPRNYKWLNTNPLPRVWEQMHLAYEYKVRDIWIVNVGDIKPMELPISFFLDYAWNPDAISPANVQAYTKAWAVQQFGKKFSDDIANLLSSYGKFNGRRKPELLNEQTYSISNYDEARRVTKEYADLLHKAESINAQLPVDSRDAFFELVLHPIAACSNLQQLYTAVALNHEAAKGNDTAANGFARQALAYYRNDSLITNRYHTIANGKWNHMMSQTHIGYTYWQQPPVQKMPLLRYVSADAAKTPSPTVPSTHQSARNKIPSSDRSHIFYEYDGYVSMEASNYTSAVNKSNLKWAVLPDLGRTGSAVTVFPVTAADQPAGSGPHLDYTFYTYDTGRLQVNFYFSPTLNFRSDAGLQYAVSVDDGVPQVVSLNNDDAQPQVWRKWVADNIIIRQSQEAIAKPGRHVLHYWMVSPAVVLQKIVLNFNELKPSYLGPPETMR